jgi:predicted ATPase/GNAT superfamily N-acetyltransferase
MSDLFSTNSPITLECTVELDEISKEIASAFDYEFNGRQLFSVPAMPEIPEKFGIGIIVGASGSGKSTLLKSLGGEITVSWDNGKSVASHFESAEDAKNKLGAVGLNSIPVMLRPYHVLSTGEKFRADLARRLVQNGIVDEFTSVVDRNVAKSCANALRRYVQSGSVSNLILASCHYDILEWLEPDWIFDTSTEQMTYGRCLRRPTIHIELLPCKVAAWSIFSEHHYLDGNINPSARCWLASWDNVVVGFASCIAFPSGNWRNGWRGHRTVILPDFQGLGLGTRISDAVGEIILSEGGRYFSKTSNHRMGDYRNRSANWRATSKNNKDRQDYAIGRKTKESGHSWKHINRVCYSHEYLGYSNNKIGLS